MLNIQQIKNDVAVRRGFRNWDHALEHEKKGLFEIGVYQDINDEVCYIFAAQFINALQTIVKESDQDGGVSHFTISQSKVLLFSNGLL